MSEKLNLKELKTYANRELPAGYSASYSANDLGLCLEVYIDDVLVISIPLNGLDDAQAHKIIDDNLRGLKNG